MFYKNYEHNYFTTQSKILYSEDIGNLCLNVSYDVPAGWKAKANLDNIELSTSSIKTVSHFTQFKDSEDTNIPSFISLKSVGIPHEIRSSDWLILHLASSGYIITNLEIIHNEYSKAEIVFNSTNASSYGIRHKGIALCAIVGMTAIVMLLASSQDNYDENKDFFSHILKSFTVEMESSEAYYLFLRNIRKHGITPTSLQTKFQYPLSWCIEEKDSSGGCCLYNLDKDGDAIGMVRISLKDAKRDIDKAEKECARLGFSLTGEIGLDPVSGSKGSSITQIVNQQALNRELWIKQKDDFFVTLLTPQAKDSMPVKALNMRGFDIIYSTLS